MAISVPFLGSYYDADHSDLQDVAGYLLKQIDNECTGNEDHTYLILRVFFQSFALYTSLQSCSSWTPLTSAL